MSIPPAGVIFWLEPLLFFLKSFGHEDLLPLGIFSDHLKSGCDYFLEYWYIILFIIADSIYKSL